MSDSFSVLVVTRRQLYVCCWRARITHLRTANHWRVTPQWASTADVRMFDGVYGVTTMRVSHPTCRWNRKKSLTTSLISKLAKSKIQRLCAPLQPARFGRQLDIISEWVLKVWERPPKSNKHQGRPAGSWPEAPVCSWEWRQTLDDPSAIWDKEHTNKALIQKACGRYLTQEETQRSSWCCVSCGEAFFWFLWSAELEAHSSATGPLKSPRLAASHQAKGPHLWVVGLMLIFPGWLQDSNLLAKVTLLPKRQ